MTGITKKQGEEGIDLYSNKENKKTVTFYLIFSETFSHKKGFQVKSLKFRTIRAFKFK